MGLSISAEGIFNPFGAERPKIRCAELKAMDESTPQSKLSRIQTLWTVVAKAHQGATREVSAAQKKLLERYGRAVYRYLLGALRDAAAAEELTQEFAVRLL